eukprot:Protomagalhaensia_wolfi_Nauph_80__2228@NODE_2448_length_1089_cov_18_755238_g1919_i0_p1_GENE_NODE_2448_length_1089_cov_18_755238_g1919_i0NODE_2448_length_1089_cov_18_755238_g1919_i0_p1_ORF_typecomplete_len131_score1_66_NODE_2448_length_1089_cov_18_755238_g1919_i0355747
MYAFQSRVASSLSTREFGMSDRSHGAHLNKWGYVGRISILAKRGEGLIVDVLVGRERKGICALLGDESREDKEASSSWYFLGYNVGPTNEQIVTVQPFEDGRSITVMSEGSLVGVRETGATKGDSSKQKI